MRVRLYRAGWPGRSRQPLPPRPPPAAATPRIRLSPALHTTLPRSLLLQLPLAFIVIIDCMTYYQKRYFPHSLAPTAVPELNYYFTLLENRASGEANDYRLTLMAIRSKLWGTSLRCTRLPWLWPYRWSPSNLRLPLNANTGNGKCDSMQVAAVLPRVLHPIAAAAWGRWGQHKPQSYFTFMPKRNDNFRVNQSHRC